MNLIDHMQWTVYFYWTTLAANFSLHVTDIAPEFQKNLLV